MVGGYGVVYVRNEWIRSYIRSVPDERSTLLIFLIFNFCIGFLRFVPVTTISVVGVKAVQYILLFWASGK